MTFDEAIDQLEPRTIWSGEMRDLLEQLRQEYAPKVEMTKEQHDLFINSTDFEKGQTNMDLGFGEMSLMQYAQIVMHPETIKVVDD
ncbi:hypothetical protein [Leuconostoc pseudomesenteroides]|uniref:hypothetical protein n=1 Tax=Leuconostoc pseudomesenteroides TaxID=33968 RepID=UPI0039EB72CB